MLLSMPTRRVAAVLVKPGDVARLPEVTAFVVAEVRSSTEGVVLYGNAVGSPSTRRRSVAIKDETVEILPTEAELHELSRHVAQLLTGGGGKVTADGRLIVDAEAATWIAVLPSLDGPVDEFEVGDADPDAGPIDPEPLVDDEPI